MGKRKTGARTTTPARPDVLVGERQALWRALSEDLSGRSAVPSGRNDAIAPGGSTLCLARAVRTADPSGMNQARAQRQATPCSRHVRRCPCGTSHKRYRGHQDSHTHRQFRTGRSIGAWRRPARAVSTFWLVPSDPKQLERALARPRWSDCCPAARLFRDCQQLL